MPKPALPPDLASARRRARRVYAVVVTVAVVAVALTMGLVIGTGEAANARLVTSTAAPAVPGGTLRSDPTPVWRTDDRAAGGNPLWIGTAVTWSAHRLAGRDASTGEVRWSYTRDDLTICDAAQRDGRAFVLFGRDGDCDELSTFDAQTGARGWFRTLPDDGEGRLEFGSTGLVIAYASSFHAIRQIGDTVDGVDRFPSVPVTGAGCRFTSVVPGRSGVAVSEQCPDGTFLALWDNNGANGKAKQLWRVPVATDVTAVAAADTAVYSYDPQSGTLSGFATATGASQAAPSLDPTPSGAAGPTQDLGGNLLLDLGGAVYDLNPAGGVTWSATSTGRATVTGEDTVSVVLTDADAVTERSASDGSVQATYTLPSSLGAGDASRQVFPAGSALLVAGPGLTLLR